MMDSVRSAGANLFLWHGRALVVGPGIDSTPHAHYAVQLTLGLDAPFRARLGSESVWIETLAAVFASSQEHQLDCGGGMLAHLFVELPPRQQGVASRLQAQYHMLPDFVPVGAAINAARRGLLDIDAAETAAQQWLNCALPTLLAPGGFDARIGKTLQWLAEHPQARPDGALLAAQVHLSESRFTRLFRQQTGLTLSRYLLWTRLLAAVDAIAGGENMTSAAYRAGFSDLAHMSRTFRSMMGVVPSELHKMTIAFKRKAQ